MRNDNINILNFFKNNNENDEDIVSFIRGHLYIEALMSEIIDRAYIEPGALSEVSTTFFKKVKLIKSIGLLTNEFEDLLININQIRNKLAHRLGFNISFVMLFNLVQKAYYAGVDFSDDTIYLDRNECEQNYGISGVINELMCNTFYQLVWNNEDLFTEDEINNFLC